MTDQEIIEMANQAGFECTIHKQFTKANTFVEVGTVVEGDFANLTQFAKLIAQKERDACALMVMPLDESLADEIRERGQE
jgi:hypothetical protein